MGLAAICLLRRGGACQDVFRYGNALELGGGFVTGSLEEVVASTYVGFA